jgi:hypothetical protein
MKNKIWVVCFGSMIILFLTKCTRESPPTNSSWSGSGVDLYTDYEPLSKILLRTFYYIPQKASPTSPVVFVLHGAERNAMDYRNALINQAEEKGFIVIVPEFSEVDFPGVSSFQIGNVYQNGDEPTVATLNPESIWSLSLIEPLFNFVKLKTQNTSKGYLAVGHSGGAQFLHRFLMFKSGLRLEKAVISAAGWYTLPDNKIDFPYGIKNSPFADMSFKSLWKKNVIIQVGSADNNSNSSSLRQTPEAQLQGANRLERAQYFYKGVQDRAKLEATECNWGIQIVPGLTHDYVKSVNNGAALLFP